MDARLPSLPKRFLIALLAAITMFSMFPATALAELVPASEEEESESLGTAYITITTTDTTNSNYNFAYGYDSTNEKSISMALIPVDLDEVAKIELEDYDLENFYWSYYWGEGDYEYDYDKVNLLKVLIYVMENYYEGGMEELETSGTPHSLFFDNYYGLGYNFLYYVNGDYPIDEGMTLAEYGTMEGPNYIGASADAIEITDGDFINVNGFESGDFWHDSNAAFNFLVPQSVGEAAKSEDGYEITSSDIEIEYAAEAGSKFTVYAVHACGNLNDGSPCWYELIDGTDNNCVVYLNDLGDDGIFDDSDGEIEQYPYVESDGSVTFDLADVEPGEYLIHTDVVYGADEDPDNIVAGPTAAYLTVYEKAQILTESLDGATLGEEYSATIEVEGYPDPEVTVTGLPDGLSYDSETGTISGTPTEAGEFTVSVEAENEYADDSESYTLVVSQPAAITTTELDSAYVDQEYSATIEVEGYPDVDLYISSDSELPEGLSFDTETGTISGTPTETGSYTISVLAKNSLGTDSATFTLDVVGEAPEITTTELASGMYGEEYSATIETSGDPAPTFEATGLPDGLSIDSETGAISGTCENAGVYEVTVTATNYLGSDSQTYSLVMGEAPAIATASLGSALKGEEYSATIEVSGAPSPTVTVSGLPDGLSYDSDSGTISGAPTEAGEFSVEVSAENAVGFAGSTLTLEVYGSPSIAVDDLDIAVLGEEYSDTIEISANPEATLYYGEVSLPDGLSIDADGNITGTPTETGEFPIEVIATNEYGTSESVTVMLYVYQAPEITTEELPIAYRNEAYSYQLEATGYPSDQIVWSLVETDSSKISVSEDGVVSATLTSVKTYEFTVQAEIEGVGSVQKTFSLECIRKQDTISTGYAYVSISKDGEFVVSDGSTSGTTMDYVKIKLSNVDDIDLEDYDLEEYNWDGDDDGSNEITLLHLLVYVLEHYYDGGVEEGLALSTYSSPGSLWITGLWGVDSPYLTYTEDYTTPADSVTGYSLTADRIELNKSSEYTFTILTGSSIYGDESAGDYYFVDDDGEPMHTATGYTVVGNEFDLMHSVSSWSSELGTYDDVSVAAGRTVQVIDSSGNVVSSGTTDEDGTISVTFANSGTYYVYASGAIGSDGITVVSGPARVTVTVEDSSAAAVTTTEYTARNGAVSVELEASGTPDATWTLADGSSLPEGLSLSDDGEISGDYDGTGTYTFDVVCDNGVGEAQTATITLTLVSKYEQLEGTVYVSISYEGGFVFSNETAYAEAGIPIANLEVDLAEASQFDLEEHGYASGCNYDADDDGSYDFTALQLLAYVAENYYGEDGLNVQTSGWINDIWGLGISGNCGYDINGVYSTSTCRKIVMEDGDRFDLAAYSTSNWYWYTDSNAGFLYFADNSESYDAEDLVTSYDAVAGEAATVYLVHNGYGSSTITSNTRGTTIYYGREYSSDPNDAYGSTVVFYNDGAAHITFPEGGVWYVWAYGLDGTSTTTDGYAVTSAALATVYVSGAPSITTEELSTGTAGEEYSATIETDSLTDVTWYLSDGSDLPDGLSFDSETGTISGTPTEAGEFSIVLMASNEYGTSDIVELVLTVVGEAPVISTESLDGTVVGEDYSTAIEVSGTPAPTVTVAGLPDGLSYDSEAGTISGAATESGAFIVTVVAENVLGTVEQTYELVVEPAEEAPTIITTSLPSATVGSEYEVTIETTGYPDPSFLLASTTGLPDGLTFSEGTISGTPTEAGEFQIALIAYNSIGKSDSVTLTLVVEEPATSIADAVMTLSEDEAEYTGEQIAPEVTVTLSDGTVLAEGTDYTVSYADADGNAVESMTETGTYTITATGVGSYTDSVSATFKITRSVDITRLYGSDRYATMRAIVSEAYAGETSDYVVVASGEVFADALSAASLAGALDAPILLVSDSDASAAAEAVQELEPETGLAGVYVVGGESTIPDGVAGEVAAAAGLDAYTRVAGEGRQGTSREVAQTVLALEASDGSSAAADDATGDAAADEGAAEEAATNGGAVSTAIIASGTRYPDALSASPYSYACCAPIYLAENDGTVSAETLSAIEEAGYSQILIVGGAASVYDGAESELESIVGEGNVERLAGGSRYETSANFAEWCVENAGMTYDNCAVAYGGNFPDALAGATICGRSGSVLLLCDGSTVAGINAGDSEESWYGCFADAASSVSQVYLLGGAGSVSGDSLGTVEDVFDSLGIEVTYSEVNASSEEE